MSPSTGEFDDDDLWNFAPKKVRESNAGSHDPVPDSGLPPWKRSPEGDAAPQNATPKSTQVAWKRSKGQRPFAGDVANKLALAPNRLSWPPAAKAGTKYGIAVRLAGAAMIMAAGISGYKLGSRPPASPFQPASRSGQAAPPELVSSKLAQPLKSAPLSSASPALPSRVGSEQPQQPRESPKPTISAADAAAVGNRAPAIARDDRERALKFKQKGDEELTQGLIAPARLLYERAADLGLPQAALALAATYDETALARANLQGVRPDPKAAEHWYERANRLGLLDHDRQDQSWGRN